MTARYAFGVAIMTAAAAAAVGCDRATVEPDALRTFGPESLTVAFTSAPDTLVSSTEFTLSVIASNRSSGTVTVTLQCAESGFLIRVMDSQGAAREHMPACASGTIVSPITMIAGDSIVANVRIPSSEASGTYRLEASYGTDAARSRIAQRGLVIRNASACPSDRNIAFALNVAVRDAVTNAFLPAVVVVTDGSFSETLAPGPGAPGQPGPGSYFGAAERTGTYTVTVTSAGYGTWRREGTVVTRGADCHVQGVSLLAALTRLP